MSKRVKKAWFLSFFKLLVCYMYNHTTMMSDLFSDRSQIDFQVESQSAGDIGKSNNYNFSLPTVVFQLYSM